MYLLVQNAVSRRPKHGHEVAKQISAMFDRIHFPASRSNYPTFQPFEDMGYVVGQRVDAGMDYTITESRRECLSQKRSSLDAVVLHILDRKQDEEFSILRSVARLQKTSAHVLSRGRRRRIRYASRAYSGRG